MEVVITVLRRCWTQTVSDPLGPALIVTSTVPSQTTWARLSANDPPGHGEPQKLRWYVTSGTVVRV